MNTKYAAHEVYLMYCRALWCELCGVSMSKLLTHSDQWVRGDAYSLADHVHQVEGKGLEVLPSFSLQPCGRCAGSQQR